MNHKSYILIRHYTKELSYVKKDEGFEQQPSILMKGRGHSKSWEDVIGSHKDFFLMLMTGRFSSILEG